MSKESTNHSELPRMIKPMLAQARSEPFNCDKTYEYPIFDFGMATKGPVHFLGNPTITGINSNNEADIFIDSQNTNLTMLVRQYKL